MEALETMQARHRKEQRDLQSRITSKKKNATKKTRKGVNDECAQLEKQLKEKHEQEIATLNGDVHDTPDGGEDRHPHTEDDDDTPTPADPTNGISQKLKDTTLSPSSDTNDNAEAAISNTAQLSQPKKRNRQKERMARRAAEQEAAAAAAEEEAANMTDHRTEEQTSLRRAFAAHGLVEKEIRPDGHCLFAAVADQLLVCGVALTAATSSTNNTNADTEVPPYKTVRRAATAYMATHADDFAPFLEEPLDTYVAKMRDTAEWGGQLELTALANAYGVEIRVVQDGRTETIEPSVGGGGGEERKTVWLAYYRHGYGLGEHYNSLRKAG
ncbi:OTU-domain-containing protein [Hypoxylon fragiforme]|uniref:OTU-domain-containing protein n=1 Tax=Hypoxylon fragiforme TaxID=63214 RepID=UPI0020C66988|nr:OTU-domain-containing protein [Hypoxylon fragiforme]KAI2605962.1 OTU-domain-containing protein [Hypoxylon fragiforme]